MALPGGHSLSAFSMSNQTCGRKRKLSCIDSPTRACSRFPFHKDQLEHGPLGNSVSNEVLAKMASINIPRRSVILLIGKYLQENGYSNLAEDLSRQSGVALDMRGVDTLLDLVNNGDYQGAIQSLPALLPDQGEDAINILKNNIFRYRVRELVETGNPAEALKFIRSNSIFVQLPKKEAFDVALSVLFSNEQAPQLFVEQLQDGTPRAPPNIKDVISGLIRDLCCVAEGRLEALLKYSMLFQMNHCAINSAIDAAELKYNLFKDQFVFRHALPTAIVQTMDLEKDSLWHIEYSHNGLQFAVTCRDHALAIFGLNQHNKYYSMLKGYRFDTIPTMFKWSPDDTMLLVITTCGRYVVFLCLLENPGRDVDIHTTILQETATCIDWFPDSKRYVVGTIDGNLYISSIDGHIIHQLHGFRSTCIYVFPSGEAIVFADQLKRILLWNLRMAETRCVWQDEELITGLYPCPDGQHVLFTVKGRGIYLFSLRYSSVVRAFNGVRQHNSSAKCSFMPGINSKIFCSSCESGCMVFWHLARPEPIKSVVVRENVSTNSVSWCPTDATTLVTASEDSVITVWRACLVTQLDLPVDTDT